MLKTSKNYAKTRCGFGFEAGGNGAQELFFMLVWLKLKWF